MISATSFLLADAGVWYAFANSDGMGKSIVFLLIIGSVIAWCVMLEKSTVLYRSLKLSVRFAAAFDKGHGMNSVLREAMNNPCPVAKVYISGMECLLDFYGQTAEEACSSAARDKSPRKLSPAQLDAVQTAMEREISSQIFVIEERIGWLATAVSLAPFLGLFGTVWGVMIAFCGVASAGSANIQALAPGVAGALLTTVAGLIVAIPSLIGYNLLTNLIRKITVSMDNFSESFMARLKLEQLNAVDEDELKKVPAMTQPQTAVNRPAASVPVNRPVQQQTYQQPMPTTQQQYRQVPQAYQQPVQPPQMQYQQTLQAYQQPVQYQNPAPAPDYQTPLPPDPNAPAEQLSFDNMGNAPEDSVRN